MILARVTDGRGARQANEHASLAAGPAGAVPVTIGAGVLTPGHGGHAPVTAPPMAFTAPVTAITVTESGRRVLFPRRPLASAAGAAAFTRAGGRDKINRGEEDSRACGEILVPAIKAKSVEPLHGHEQAIWVSGPSRLAFPSPFLEQLPALSP
jgi:hypothetical protein